MANELEPITIMEEDADGTPTNFEITTAQAPEGALGDDIVTALFDDGTAASEVTYADINGDGSADVGAADTDGDGQLDRIAGDTDGDGMIDAAAADTDGDGNLDVVAVDTDADGVVDAVGEDTDGDGSIDLAQVDTDGDGEFDAELSDTDGDGEFEEVTMADEGLPTEEEISTNSVEFTVGEDGFPVTDPEISGEYTAEYTDETSDEYVAGTAYDDGSGPVFAAADVPASGTDYTAADSTEAEDLTEQAHADAAREAQAQADEYIAHGDYAAAAEAREVAENEAWEAGDPGIIESSDYTSYGASDSSELENAAYKQEIAEDYRAQQAEHIADGDYAAAKEDAQNAAYATGDADYLAGGADHTGQSDQDAYNLDNAVYQEKNADYFVDNAEWYAEAGNPDAAQSSLDTAAGYQESADTYAATADPVSPMYDVDPSSAVDVGGGYDMYAVDTGFDASVDTTPVSYDSGVDDGTV
jgi:hypothetical protein